MKYIMKSLIHRGICIPSYELKGFSIRIQGQRVKLGCKTEQMAIAWVRKEQSLTSPPDKLFYTNFMQSFLEALKTENPSLEFLNGVHINYDAEPIVNGNPRSDMEVDFSEVREFLSQEKARKLAMTKEEKKKLTAERKAKREELKRTFGYAIVDGKNIEIANYTAEPSCLFAGRGEHPKRGSWKEGPQQSDIILNLSPGCPSPPGNWKGLVWEPDKMYIAKWDDHLSGKIKYVWFSDSTFMKQMREKEKFKKAEKLGNKIQEIAAHIMNNLDAEREERRKIATVCWLILELNMRVGDEKDLDEADTVGAITLRPEHIKLTGDTLQFDFLGKDAVRWTKEAKAPPSVIRNIQHFSKTCKEYLFEGVDSKKVARFFSEKMKGLTAKVFRTWRCTQTVEEALKKCRVTKEDPEYKKKYCAKTANLQAAKVANHKRKIPVNFEQRLAEREAKLRELENMFGQKKAEGKNTEGLQKRVEKSRLDVDLMKETKEYNLGTSLKSYIDPMAYVKWADQKGFDLEKFYSKTLRNKFSWALKARRRSEETQANLSAEN